MNELLPIVRRVRRPLVAPDVPPVVVGNIEPVKMDAERGVQSAGQDVALRANGRPYLTPALSLPPARAGEGEPGKGESKPAETQSE